MSKKTKKSVLILSICYLPNIGGVETHLQDLENELVKRNWNVTVLTYQPLNTPTLGKWIEKKRNVTIYRLPIIRGIFYGLVDRPFLEFLFLFPLQFIALPLVLLRHSDIRTINAQGIVSGFTASIWSKIFRKKYVIAAQSIYNFPTSGLYCSVAKWIFGSADTVLVQSIKSRNEITSLGISKSKIVVFTHWEDTKKFRPLSKKVSKKKVGFENKFVVSFFGRLIDKKGIPPLLEAVKLIDPNIILAIYGEGPQKPNVQKTAKKYKNVLYKGIISPEELPLHYNAADIVIMPSTHSEGFGRVAAGSLLCGTPVIASNQGELPNVVNEKVGEIIKVTPENIANSINKLYGNEGLLKKKASKTRSYAIKRFSERNAESILKTYS